MPRPNQPRTIDKERQLAARIVELRDQQGFNNQSLARRMTDAGCPIRDSAIHKIEKGDPPRRITVDELYGFAAAFKMSVQDLLLWDPSNPVLQSRIPALMHKLEELYRQHRDANRARPNVFEQLHKEATSSRQMFEGFQEFVSAEWNDWQPFLAWAGVEELLETKARPRGRLSKTSER